MDLLTLIGHISDFVGVGGALFALFAWLQTKKLNQKLETEQKRRTQLIKIVLADPTHKRKILPLGIRRDELTRAEILGRLGMLPMHKPGDRFAITYLSSEEFLQDLDTVKQGDGVNDRVTIWCSEAEFAQFA